MKRMPATMSSTLLQSRPPSQLVLGVDSSSPESTDETVHLLMRIYEDGSSETIGHVRGCDLPTVERLIVSANSEAAIAGRREEFRAMIGVKDMEEYARHLGYGRYAAACGMYRAAATFAVCGGPTTGYEMTERGTQKRKADNPRIGRNDPCRCGCGRKAKRCANARS
jgi:hypothetical protein